MNQENLLEKNIGVLLLLICLAYLFSMGIRMYWPMHFENVEAMRYAGELMINTNDGYFFSTGARDIIDGVVADDRQRASAYNVSSGLVLLTAYLTKLTSFSLDTVSLYLSGIISSLIVIPIILTGRLLGNTLLGFLAALIGSIAWSYYNRTMVGYYDTDMFSVFLQFMIFYSFMQVVYKKNLISIFIASFFIMSYPYFYPQGMTIVYAMFILLTLYLTLEYLDIFENSETKSFGKDTTSIYTIVILLSISLMLYLPLEYRLIVYLGLFFVLIKIKLDDTALLAITAISFLGFLYFGNIVAMILSYVSGYMDRGVTEGNLHFYQVIQTVREANSIPFSTMANRISGSQIGIILSLIGYLLLVIRHKAFLIALPLIGVGVFSMLGGLRFTVYAVPIAAISAVYLFYVLGDLLKDNIEDVKIKKNAKYLFIVGATIGMLIPNINHIKGYLVPTVLNKAEVNDLVNLDKIASKKDYTLAWWDYGYPIWYYSNTNTLIDGGKHTHDNYIISKIMFSTSPQQVVNLSKLAIETYVDSNYSIVADTIFKDKKPRVLLESLKKSDYVLPKKTRDIYLYLPYRMMNIFPTVGVFGNINLRTGKQKRRIIFYPAQAVQKTGTKIVLSNGIIFDQSTGLIQLGEKQKKNYSIDIVDYDSHRKLRVQSQLQHMDGDLSVIYMKNYNQFIIMDRETYRSTYVQMLILGKYDKNLFELVVSSPYSKIYKIK